MILIDAKDLVKIFPELAGEREYVISPLIYGGYKTWLDKLIKKYDAYKESDLFHLSTYYLSVHGKTVMIGAGTRDYSTDADEEWGIPISIYANSNSKKVMNFMRKDIIAHFKSLGLKKMKKITSEALSPHKDHLSWDVYKFFYKGDNTR